VGRKPVCVDWDGGSFTAAVPSKVQYFVRRFVSFVWVLLQSQVLCVLVLAYNRSANCKSVLA